ncbi:carbohydrate esterase family 16 protein [Piromyces sp. E2]|nr:carbohydrate esterase family 16 protein [Piromyces sp. E2]|eukprot:OUM62186.1 carbohydrate esterase family 16 protein [Piromyces sp. E2]
MYLWDFAVNNSTYGFIDPDDSSTYVLFDQHITFKESKHKIATNGWNGDEYLFIYWYGVDDCINSRFSGYSTEKIVEGSLTIFNNILNDVYNEGAKNILIMNVPSIENAPNNVNNELKIDSLIKGFNDQYYNFTKIFQDKHKDANIFLYDSYNEFKYIMENGKKYNITHISNSFNSNPNNTKEDYESYFWYDDIHPTSSVHKAFAIDIFFFLKENSIKDVQKSETHEKANSNFYGNNVQRERVFEYDESYSTRNSIYNHCGLLLLLILDIIYLLL